MPLLPAMQLRRRPSTDAAAPQPVPHLRRLLPAAHHKGQGALFVHRKLICRLKIEVEPARLLRE